jgi:hypothetical protein
VVRVTPRPRFSTEKGPPVPTGQELGGPQSWSGHKNLSDKEPQIQFLQTAPKVSRPALDKRVEKKLHDELHQMYSSPNIIMVNKDLGVHVERMEILKMHIKCWFKSLNGREHSEYLGAYGRIILK